MPLNPKLDGYTPSTTHTPPTPYYNNNYQQYQYHQPPQQYAYQHQHQPQYNPPQQFQVLLPTPLFTHLVQIDVADVSSFAVPEVCPPQLMPYLPQSDYAELIHKARLINQREQEGIPVSEYWNKQRIAQVIIATIWLVLVIVGVGMIGVGAFGASSLKFRAFVAFLPIGINLVVFSSIISLVIIALLARVNQNKLETLEEFIKTNARNYSFKHLGLKIERWPNTDKKALRLSAYPLGTSPYLITPVEMTSASMPSQSRNYYTNAHGGGSVYIRL